MPGQLPTLSELTQPDYGNVKCLAKEKKHGLLGTEVTCKSGNKTMKWKVISNHEPENVFQHEVQKFGLINLKIKEYEQGEL
jgi:hypothetical protein